MLMFIYTLHTQRRKFVESHICQNQADMGHPSFVREQAVRNADRWLRRSYRTPGLLFGLIVWF